MKPVKYITVVITLMIMSSCIKDLDVTPIDPSVTTSKDLFKNELAYKQALAKLYATYAVSSQTGGGGGLPTSYQLPNGWAYRFSSTITTLPNGFNIENGIPVTIHQDMDTTNQANGKDDILEKAFQEF